MMVIKYNYSNSSGSFTEDIEKFSNKYELEEFVNVMEVAYPDFDFNVVEIQGDTEILHEEC